MVRVTYADDEVRKLAGNYQRIVLDVNEDAETAAIFKPEAIPTAIIYSSDGIEQRRQTGYSGPIEHAEWLR